MIKLDLFLKDLTLKELKEFEKATIGDLHNKILTEIKICEDELQKNIITEGDCFLYQDSTNNFLICRVEHIIEDNCLCTAYNTFCFLEKRTLEKVNKRIIIRKYQKIDSDIFEQVEEMYDNFDNEIEELKINTLNKVNNFLTKKMYICNEQN